MDFGLSSVERYFPSSRLVYHRNKLPKTIIYLELVWISPFGLLLPNFALHFVALRSRSLGYAPLSRLVQHKIWRRSHQKRNPNKLLVPEALAIFLAISGKVVSQDQRWHYPGAAGLASFGGRSDRGGPPFFMVCQPKICECGLALFPPRCVNPDLRAEKIVASHFYKS